MKKILILFFMLTFLSGCTRPALVKRTQASLGTIVEIIVADKDKPRQFVNDTIEKAFAEIERIENLLSRFKSESEISRINANADIQPIKVSAETIILVKRSIEFSRLSAGSFDITVGSLLEVWGFTEKDKQQLPNPEAVKEALEKVGYQHIDINPQEQSIFLLRQGMTLDLGGIAKGYAVDRAIAILRQAGISRALVNAGGDIYCLGKRNKTEKWQVALQHPRKKDAILAVLELQDRAVATSGDYQKYIEIGSARYSHIINPRSGYPCADAPAGITVLAQDCLTADALATSIFVLGPEKGIDLINRLENTEAIVVNFRKGKADILLSRGLEGKLKFNL